MNRAVTSAKGFLLNLSVELNGIEVKQYRYNLMTKIWDQIHLETINTETETFSFDHQNPIFNQNEAIIFSGLVNKSAKRLICLVFDSISEKFKFDIQLSLQFSELFTLSATDIYIKLFGQKFFFFSIGELNADFGLKIYHNFNSRLECLTYSIETKFSFDEVKVLNWTSIELNTDEALYHLNFKLLTTLHFENKNKIYLHNYLIEPFGGILYLNNQKMLSQYEQFFSKDLSLLDETDNFLSLNKNYSKKSLQVVSQCLADFQIGGNRSDFYLKGTCYLNIVHNDKSFIIGLKNGTRIFTKKLNQTISRIKFIEIDDRQYLIANEKKKYLIFSLPDLKLVFESNQTLAILVDFFLEDSNHFLIIQDINEEFLLKKNFEFSPRFDLSRNSDTNDFSMELSTSFNQAEVKEGNCVADLIKVLEHKDRMSDLLKEDLLIKIRQKLALIAEISNMFYQQTNHDLTLPKLVDVFSKEFKPVQIPTHNSSLNLCDQWSCFLSQKLLLNFIIESSYELNNLTANVLIKNVPFGQTILDHESKQFSMKLDSDLVKILEHEFSEEQYFPVKFNLTDYLVINKSTFSPKLYLSVLNYYESCLTRSVVRLKIYGIEENFFTGLITEKLNFEKIFNFESKGIFYLNKQSLINDCFLISDFSNDHLKLTVYAGNNEQSILAVRLLDKYLSKMDDQLVSIEIDIDETALKNEVADYVTDESDLNSSTNKIRLGSLKELTTDNEILKLIFENEKKNDLNSISKFKIIN
ncbi:hypothetical protein BpHYR1_028843 [Brachionus plicatilis]|uniref:Uncharacterized protein n=1 Tax=Brachionus plicatilis TaxID=10195 RepID=A0A3M7P1Y2_BRAPC|nr:hypothetical protein BpHYR1_028843 [Brachionus plicatilis]